MVEGLALSEDCPAVSACWSSWIKGRQVCPAKSQGDSHFWGPRDSIYFTCIAVSPASPVPFLQSAELCRAASLSSKLSCILMWSKAGLMAILQQAKPPSRARCAPPFVLLTARKRKARNPDTHQRSSHPSTSAGSDILGLVETRHRVAQGFAGVFLFTTVLPFSYPTVDHSPHKQ